MRIDLSADQWRAPETGELVAPNGTRFLRRATRAKRKALDFLIAAGAPLVTYWPGGLPEHTRLHWHDGPDAQTAWQNARNSLISSVVRLDHGAVATAGTWESDAGDVAVLLTWRH